MNFVCRCDYLQALFHVVPFIFLAGVFYYVPVLSL